MEEETEETQQYYGTKMSSAYVHFALSIFFVVVVGGRGGVDRCPQFDEQVFLGEVYMTGYKSWASEYTHRKRRKEFSIG